MPASSYGAAEPRTRIFRSLPGSSLRISHTHPEVEFNLVTKGSGSYTVDGHKHDLRPATLIWLLPGQKHHLVRGPALEFWAVLGPTTLITDAEMESLRASPVRELTGTNVLALDQLLSQVSQDSDEPSLFDAGVLYAFRRALLGGTLGVQAGNVQHPAVVQALILLDSHDGPDTLVELSRSCDQQPAHLSRLLRQQTGRGFIELRNRARLRQFVSIYKQCGNISQAALQARFGSIAQFYKVFGSVVGTTPKQWSIAGGKIGDLDQLDDRVTTEVGGEREDVRWYKLTTMPLAATQSVVNADFVNRLMEQPAARIRSITFVSSARRSVENRRSIAAEYRNRGSQLGAQFQQLTETIKFEETFGWLCDLYGVPPNDVATYVGVYLAAALTAVHNMADLSQDQGKLLFRQVQVALIDDRTLLMADDAERQEVAEALLYQAIIIYQAVLAARGSGSPWLQRYLSKSVSRAFFNLTGKSLTTIRVDDVGYLQKA